MMMQATLVFFAMAALDFVWAGYTRAVVKKATVTASAAASLIIVLSGTAAIGYTHDPIMLLPAAAGAFLGTFLALRLAP